MPDQTLPPQTPQTNQTAAQQPQVMWSPTWQQAGPQQGQAAFVNQTTNQQVPQGYPAQNMTGQTWQQWQQIQAGPAQAQTFPQGQTTMPQTQQMAQPTMQQAPTPPHNPNEIDLWDVQLDDAHTAPYNPTWWQIMGKLSIGFFVGLCISFVVFGIIAVVGKNIFMDTLNPLLPLIMLLIAFLCTFIGNIAIWLVYNLVYSEKYYDMSKIFGLVLLSNFLLFLTFAPVYLLFTDNVDVQFLVLSFHIVFGIFISLSLIEFLSNPNYASSHLIGTMIGFMVTMLLYLFVFKNSQTGNIADNLYYLIIIPPLLGYSLSPFFHAIWELIYYKFYEMWNNFFYLPGLNEITNNGSDDHDSDDDNEDNQINVSID